MRFLSHPYFRNSFWAILGSFVSKGLNFISIAYVARILGPQNFGEYNVIQTTVGLFGTVSGLGLGLATTKLVAEWRDRDKERTGQVIGTLYSLSVLISILISIVFLLTSGWIASSLLSNTELTTLMQVTSLIILFDAVNGVQNGVLSGFEVFKKITVINFWAGIISAPLLIAGAFYKGLIGLTFMLLISRILLVLITRFYLRKVLNENNIPVEYKIDKRKLQSIFSISIPSFLSGMATSPVNWVATTIFVNQPLGYSSLGVYNAANQLRQLVLFLPDSAGKVSIPRMANDFGNGNMTRFRKTVIITFLQNLILSVCPAVFIYFFSFLFKDFMGAEYVIEGSLIFLVLLTGVLIALTNAIGYIFICSNLIWYDFFLRIFWGLALILFLIFYGKHHGALGYAISIVGASVVHMIAQVIVLLYKLSYKKLSIQVSI
ncbi:MAG TPA: oligosaccharide flippase family protein [Chitinophagaceae bacterium]|nr:oligosaccharide flippase family protein [Chitinophagaceae bacterium]